MPLGNPSPGQLRALTLVERGHDAPIKITAEQLQEFVKAASKIMQEQYDRPCFVIPASLEDTVLARQKRQKLRNRSKRRKKLR